MMPVSLNIFFRGIIPDRNIRIRVCGNGYAQQHLPND